MEQGAAGMWSVSKSILEGRWPSVGARLGGLERYRPRVSWLEAKQPSFGNALHGEHIEPEEVVSSVWSIVYYHTLFGRSDEWSGLIAGL
jgi:hypothetical protein